jgi:hypothetical protein
MKQAGRPPREAHPKHSFEGDEYSPDLLGAVSSVSTRPKGERPLKREFPPGFDLNPENYRKAKRKRK